MLKNYVKLIDKVLINFLLKSGIYFLVKVIEIFSYEEYFSISFKFDGLEFEILIFLNCWEVFKGLKKENIIFNIEEISIKISIGVLIDLYVEIFIFKYWFDVIKLGKYIFGYILKMLFLSFLFEDINYYYVFIICDFRVVVVLFIFFFLDMGKMLVKYFLEVDIKFMFFNECVNFILIGGFVKNVGVEIKGFVEVYCFMLVWCNEFSCLFLCFEDLVGEGGGGSYEK